MPWHLIALSCQLREENSKYVIYLARMDIMSYLVIDVLAEGYASCFCEDCKYSYMCKLHCNNSSHGSGTSTLLCFV
jgi:hypothetical protein